ncbi:MAG: universal stress protein [Steroidobacteraceae bacterium]
MQPIARRATLLERWSEPLRADGLEVTVECTTAKHLYPAILKRACATGIELIVKDTHHHSLAQRAFLTNTDWHLIRECKVPLLLTKPQPWKDRPVFLAALDPDHLHHKPDALDEDLLEWGATLRSVLGGELHAVHAYIPRVLAAAVGSTAGPAAVTPELTLEEEARQLAQLRHVIAPYDIAEKHTHVDIGSPVETIQRIADTLLADITILGAISRSSPGLLFIRPTAERALERLGSDVLVVKPPDFSDCLPF